MHLTLCHVWNAEWNALTSIPLFYRVGPLEVRKSLPSSAGLGFPSLEGEGCLPQRVIELYRGGLSRGVPGENSAATDTFSGSPP